MDPGVCGQGATAAVVGGSILGHGVRFSKDTTVKRRPEIIPLPFPKTIPTLPAAAETISEHSLAKPILLKPVERTPFLPSHQKRSLESPPFSIPNEVEKSEPSVEDVRLLLKTETIETPQRKPKVGDFFHTVSQSSSQNLMGFIGPNPIDSVRFFCNQPLKISLKMYERCFCNQPFNVLRKKNVNVMFLCFFFVESHTPNHTCNIPDTRKKNPSTLVR
ncbi:hypothetical protein NPIL_304311 [Nephila pilipes]|uniref:Uncharacterized protein n=1 Tax=Nephila pilipes TaxID=299642 RepID=A0A8X6U9L4_NEPPI|nr:hypothetical protein NPIL_304311 [Nephila pilipes]